MQAGGGMLYALVALIVLLAAALVAVGVLWARSRRAAAEAARALESVQRKVEQARTEKDDLKKRDAAREAELEMQLASVTVRTWIERFDPQNVYRLLSRHETDVDGDARSYGLVRDEVGTLSPYLTRQSLAHLEVGDHFSTVRGQIVRLEAPNPDSGPGPASAPPQSTVPPPAPTRPAAAGAAATSFLPAAGGAGAGADDRTRIIGGPAPDETTDSEAGLPYLRVTAGPDRGSIYRLPFGEARIGRDEANEVHLSDTGTSRVHCVVSYDGQAFRLRDNHSTNGTLCNGQRVADCALDFGDTISVGETEMAFMCDGFELKGRDPDAAIADFEKSLARAPDFLVALKNLAFLLERNVARQREAQPVWEHIARLERPQR